MTNNSQMEVSFTVVKSDSDIGKRFSAPDGKTIRKEVLGALYAGTTMTQVLRGATAADILDLLCATILGLVVNHALLLGMAVNGKTENRITTKGRAQAGQAADAIARTKDNFRHSAPLALLLIDNDGGRETPELLETVWPPFREVAMLVLPSSSSAVMLHGEPAKDGGEHTYLVLRGGRQKEVLKRLLDLCAINDRARIMIAKNGRMLLRGPVDASVWGAERVIFPGVNHTVAPVEQGPREPELHEGDVLNADLFLLDTERLVDQAELKRVIDEMKAAKQPEADRAAEAWAREHVKKAVEKAVKAGVERGHAQKRIKKQIDKIVRRVKAANRAGPEWDEREHVVLEADLVITLSDGTQVTVREICADPGKYEGMHCADPFEGPEYGSSTATILVNGKGEPWIYSHAHGASVDYHLVVRELIDPSHEFAGMSLEQLLAAASGRGKCPKADTPANTEEAVRRGRDAEFMIRAAVAAKADDTVRETLKKALEHMAGLKPGTFNKLWKAAKHTRDRFEADDAADDDEPDERPAGEPPRGYRVVGGWMCKMVQDGDRTIDVPICHPLKVVSRGRNAKSEEWGVRVEFLDLDGRLHSASVPMALLGGDAREALDMLTSAGLHLAGADKLIRSAVADLLIRWTPDTRVTVSGKTGWVEGYKAFLLGNGVTIGDQSYVFQPVGAVTGNALFMRPSGAIEDWRDTVAALAVGNPVMVLALSTAFAGPLLEIINAESGGVHLRSTSSDGKTTTLGAAASVWGKPDKITMSWRAPANGLEAIAGGANGTLLVLDEINMVKASDAGIAAYMLANERGKHRADRAGGAREAYTWKFLFLSSGEIDLESKMNEDGITQRAGQEVRLLNVAVGGHQFGAFDDLHGSANGAAFSDRVKLAALAAHGTAGPLMVEKLIVDIEGGRVRAQTLIGAFTAQATAALGEAVASQVRRALYRFAVIAAAGEMASGFGITGWRPGTASAAAVAAFTRWVEDRGISPTANAEQRMALERTRDHLARHGASRYEQFPLRQFERTPQREGWMDDEHFWIAEHAWREIHAGADYKQAARTLAELGWLVLGEGRNIKKKKRGLPRCYCVKKAILNARAGMTTDEIERDDPMPETDSDLVSGIEASVARFN